MYVVCLFCSFTPFPSLFFVFHKKDLVLRSLSTRYMKFKCDALRDLVPFLQFKKCEKQPWTSVNFSKVAGLSITNEKFKFKFTILTVYNSLAVTCAAAI